MHPDQHALFERFALPLIGLPVSHTWQGYGSAIFLEFGALTPRTLRDGSLGNPTGELGLMIEWGWRIEGRRTVLCGCDTDKHRWPRALNCLTKATVSDVTLVGRLPEIAIALSSGLHVASFMTERGNPEWALFDYRGGSTQWLTVQAGRLHVEESSRSAFPDAAFSSGPNKKKGEKGE